MANAGSKKLPPAGKTPVRGKLPAPNPGSAQQNMLQAFWMACIVKRNKINTAAAVVKDRQVGFCDMSGTPRV